MLLTEQFIQMNTEMNLHGIQHHKQYKFIFSFLCVCEELYHSPYDVTGANVEILEMFMNQTGGCQEVCRSLDTRFFLSKKRLIKVANLRK